MAGHSKWAGIKHKKAIIDSKRGKIFTKLAKEITVAARLGGGDPAANPRLRTAIAKARGTSMPNDNIDKAIKKGTGDLEGVTYEEISYEGYGPGGVAVMLDVMTDNKNRTVAEIRSIFTKAGGQLGENGCVGWMFDKKGLIVVDKEVMGEDELMEAALEAGAEDILTESAVYEIYTPWEDLETVREALEQKEIAMISAEVAMIPQNTIKIETVEMAKKLFRLMETLEDQEDAQNVFSNFDVPDEIAVKIEG